MTSTIIATTSTVSIPTPRRRSRSPFIALGLDVFERILSHLCDEPLPHSYLTTDAIRLILPFALTCTDHYYQVTRLIRRLSILPLGLTALCQATSAHPTPPPVPFKYLFNNNTDYLPPQGPAPRTLPLPKISPIALERALLRLPNLRALHLSLAVPASDDTLHAVSLLLPSLRELRIPGNGLITAHGLSSIASRCKLLHTLDLSYCKRLADDAAPILLSMPSLVRLDVSYWKISDDFIARIATIPTLNALALTACTKLTSDTCRVLGRSAHALHRLKFRCAPGLRDDGVRELVKCSSLHSLDLSLSKNLSDEGVAALGDPDRLPWLENVLLSQCRMLTDFGVKLLARNTAIRRLDLSFCDLLTDECAKALQALRHLEEVDLSGCRNLTDRAVSVISVSRSLLKIKLTHCNKLTDESAKAIASAPNVPLQSVDVWKCHGISTLGLETLRIACTKLRC